MSGNQKSTFWNNYPPTKPHTYIKKPRTTNNSPKTFAVFWTLLDPVLSDQWEWPMKKPKFTNKSLENLLKQNAFEPHGTIRA